MRVGFDTNIYISAFAIPGGKAEEAYLQAGHGRFELFTSVAILTKTAGVLQTKFDLTFPPFMRPTLRELNQYSNRLKHPVVFLFRGFSFPTSRKNVA